MMVFYLEISNFLRYRLFGLCLGSLLVIGFILSQILSGQDSLGGLV